MLGLVSPSVINYYEISESGSAFKALYQAPLLAQASVYYFHSFFRLFSSSKESILVGSQMDDSSLNLYFLLTTGR